MTESAGGESSGKLKWIIAAIVVPLVGVIISGIFGLLPTILNDKNTSAPVISVGDSTSSAPGADNSSTPAISASQKIALDIESTTDAGTGVSSATCDQGSVQADADGSDQAECDVTLVNGDIMRASVTDGNGDTTIQNQYQENLSATEIANSLVGLYGTITESTVVKATCTPSSIQLEADGTTDAECYLYMANGDSFPAAVTYNGVSGAGFTGN